MVMMASAGSTSPKPPSSRPPGLALGHAVGVQALQKVDPGEGEQHRQEAHERRSVAEVLPRPLPLAPAVQVAGIHQPRHQRGRLLGVPAPPALPDVLRPYGAGDDDHGQQREAEGHRACRCCGRSAPAAAGDCSAAPRIRHGYHSLCAPPDQYAGRRAAGGLAASLRHHVPHRLRSLSSARSPRGRRRTCVDDAAPLPRGLEAHDAALQREVEDHRQADHAGDEADPDQRQAEVLAHAQPG